MNRTAVATFAALVVGAVAVHLYFSISLGLMLLALFVGWPLVGTLITIDDDFEGGWSNPDGKVRPPWLQVPFWGQIIAGLALSSCGAAIDFGWNTETGALFWVASFVGFVVGVPMMKKGTRAHAG
jgi:hypothetical protein